MKQEYQSILAAGIEKKYLALEEEIMKDVVRRIKKTGRITSTVDWQLQRYMVLGHSTEDVENIIRQALGGDWADTFKLYDEVVEQEYVRSRTMYEQINTKLICYEQNYELQQITNALIQQSNDELFNISRSLGFMVDMGSGRKVFSPLSEVYNGYLDNAITMMASGAFDYNTLIRKVVGEMTTSGLRTVDYVSGRSNRVDVAVRRALLTGMGQLTGQISRMNGQRLGTDKYEVDWHPGARPEHAVWQGRVWTYQQLIDVCGLGSGPGLLGWNCRHSYYPFLDGISARNYSDEWLEAMDRKEAQKIPYRGREYNTYEATQKQRQMETAMRAQRQKAQLLKQGGADSDDILNARCKYQAMLDEYKEFSKKFHLPEQRERIYYDLRGRVAPSQRTYETWEAEQADKAAKRAAAKERKAERAMRERAEKNRRADMDALQKNVTQAPDADIIVSKKNLAHYVGAEIVKTDNQSIREWYYANVNSIPNQIDDALPLEQQARQAYGLRNQYKHQARAAMSDVETARVLEQKRPAPDFEELVRNKMKRKDMSREEALEDILKTASKTNADVNKEFGL